MFRIYNRTVIFSFLILLCQSCNINKINDPAEYLYISHTRVCNEDLGWAIDSTLASIPYEDYEAVLLGGDMLCQSSLRDTGLLYLERVFSIHSKKTLWSIGNHDDDDRELWRQYTNRNTYYAFHHQKTTFIVLDSEIDDCRITGDQLDFFKNVTDSIENTKNLIVMSHKLIWMHDISELKLYGESRSNVKVGKKSWNIKKNNFSEDLYPVLVDLAAKGVNVICVGGDLGVKSDVFEYKTKEGVFFLGNGIGKSNSDNKILLFKNYSDSITWDFISVDSLEKK